MPLSKLKISASGIPRRMGECDTILYNVGERLAPLKPKIAGALKTQLSNVALHKHSVVRTTYGKLHAVAALYLKGHIIGRERMRHRIVCMVARNFRALCHNRCRNSQPRRMVVFIPCADISDDGV